MMNKEYDRDEWRNLKLLVTFSRCYASVNKRIYPYMKNQGVTEAQFSVLELLYHRGEFTIKEVIEKTFSSGGTMTVIINNLEKEGLVIKKRSEKDRRVFIIKISQKGTELMEEVFDKHLENLKKAFGVLTEAEQMIMIELLKKLGKG